MLPAYSTPIVFTNVPIRGFYWVALIPWVRTIISDAISAYQVCPHYDGVVAGELPTFEQSSCPVFRTQRILYALWQALGWRSQWNYVLSFSPTLSESEEAALDRIMAYVEDLGLFSSEIYPKRRTIAKGVLVVVLNDYEDPGQNISPQKVITTFSLQIYPTPTTASNCPSMTITYPYAKSPSPTVEKVVSTRRPFSFFQS